jgi:prepilin-type N-terminal cleavage/methylation domain-containing protein
MAHPDAEGIVVHVYETAHDRDHGPKISLAMQGQITIMALTPPVFFSMNTPRPLGRGFTLIELLVVVTIIVVLLALLTPALDQAIERAERTVCAASLDAHSMAMNQYAMENRRRYLTAPRHFSHQVAYPLAAYMYSNIHPGDWSVEAINPYLGLAAVPVVGGLPKIWRCPSNQATHQYDLEWDNAVRHGRAATAQHDGSFVHSQWAVYAGVEQWKTYQGIQVPSNPEQLARSTVGSQGIIMADAIYRHQSAVWLYNHGDYSQADSVPKPIPGVNRAYGDGGVEWAEFSEARQRAIVPGQGDPEDQYPYTSNNGAGNGDLNYY